MSDKLTPGSNLKSFVLFISLVSLALYMTGVIRPIVQLRKTDSCCPPKPEPAGDVIKISTTPDGKTTVEVVPKPVSTSKVEFRTMDGIVQKGALHSDEKCTELKDGDRTKAKIVLVGENGWLLFDEKLQPLSGELARCKCFKR